jgi:hypothetical protein
MKKTIFLPFIVLAVSSAAMARPGAETKAEPRAEVLVLGTYHMANPGRDIFNMSADDVLSPKRQQEIADLLAVLKKFRPTKIAIESLVFEKKRQELFAEYLIGKYTLTRNEIDQVGYRLAKELGMKQVYPVDYDGDFPMQRVANFAKAKGREKEWEENLSGFGALMRQFDEYLKSHTVLETLLLMNSDQKAAENIGLYYIQAHYGEPGDYAGPDLLTSWYQRNIRIFNNIGALVDSPDERILVIFGWGHLGWLRQFIAGDPTLKLRTLAEFVPQPPVQPK